MRLSSISTTLPLRFKYAYQCGIVKSAAVIDNSITRHTDIISDTITGRYVTAKRPLPCSPSPRRYIVAGNDFPAGVSRCGSHTAMRQVASRSGPLADNDDTITHLNHILLLFQYRGDPTRGCPLRFDDGPRRPAPARKTARGIVRDADEPGGGAWQTISRPTPVPLYRTIRACMSSNRTGGTIYL